MALSQNSLDILSDLRFLKPDGKVNREKMAWKLKGELVENHQITRVTVDALEKYGAPISILTRFLLGEEHRDNDELLALVSHLTSTSIQGPVQKALTNGSPAFVLGSGSITKTSVITQADGTEIRRRVPLTVRYVSKNAAVIRQLMLDPLQAKKERGGMRDRAWAAMIVQRQPSLKGYINGSLLPALKDHYGKGLGLSPLGTGTDDTDTDDEDGEGDEE